MHLCPPKNSEPIATTLLHLTKGSPALLHWMIQLGLGLFPFQACCQRLMLKQNDCLLRADTSATPRSNFSWSLENPYLRTMTSRGWAFVWHLHDRRFHRAKPPIVSLVSSTRLIGQEINVFTCIGQLLLMESSVSCNVLGAARRKVAAWLSLMRISLYQEEDSEEV